MTKVGQPAADVLASKVPGVTFHRMPIVRDPRGDLTVGEFSRHVPFFPKRYFMVFNVPSHETRGEHAHKRCDQFLMCVRGSCSVIVDNGRVKDEYVLDSATVGVYMPAMTWGVQYKYTHDAVLLVFCSDYYDASDYIRSYPEFLKAVGVNK